MGKIILSMDGLVLKELALRQERLTVGRKPHNDIQIDNMSISGEHAVIVTILGDSFLEDLDSTNGTLVNGQPVKKHFLRDGDVVELGKYQLKYLEDAPPLGLIEVADVSPPLPLEAVQLPQAEEVVLQPHATLQLLTGPNAGRFLSLTKPRTSVGRPGVQIAIIERHDEGHYISHADGSVPPMLNGQYINTDTKILRDRDILEISGVGMEFRVFRAA